MSGIVSARRLAGSQPLSEQLDRLHRTAQALCASPHDAEDLVQETLVRVLARPRRLRRGSEPAYLMGALHNTFLHSLRTAGRRPQTAELPVEAVDGLSSARADTESRSNSRSCWRRSPGCQSGFATRWWPSTWSGSPTGRPPVCSIHPRPPSPPACSVHANASLAAPRPDPVGHATIAHRSPARLDSMTTVTSVPVKTFDMLEDSRGRSGNPVD